jgi:hypothetical protein
MFEPLRKNPRFQKLLPPLQKKRVGNTAQSRRFVLPSDALSLMGASKSPMPSIGTTTVPLGNIVCVSRDPHDSPFLLDYAV